MSSKPTPSYYKGRSPKPRRDVDQFLWAWGYLVASGFAGWLVLRGESPESDSAGLKGLELTVYSFPASWSRRDLLRSRVGPTDRVVRH
jgi:hypothetical protein